MRLSAGALLILFLGAACAREPDEEQADWQVVLARKKALARTDQVQLPQAKQHYVDALRDFCRRYPSHPRAQQVYLEMELAFARELFARGNYGEAARFFESVLRDDPRNAQVRGELAEAMNRRFVSREALENLRRGLNQKEVAARIGHPAPGWERTTKKGDRVVVSWFYPRTDGGASGVHFANGLLFAAEYDSPLHLE